MDIHLIPGASATPDERNAIDAAINSPPRGHFPSASPVSFVVESSILQCGS